MSGLWMETWLMAVAVLKTAFILGKGQFPSEWDPFLNKELWVKINRCHFKQWRQMKGPHIHHQAGYNSCSGIWSHIACMCATTTCLFALHYNLSQSLHFSLNLTLSPFPLSVPSSVMLHSVHAQNAERWIHLSVFTTHVHAFPPPSLGMASDRGSDLVCISQQGGRPALASLSTYEIKSDTGDGCLWRLESLNRVQE